MFLIKTTDASCGLQKKFPEYKKIIMIFNNKLNNVHVFAEFYINCRS